MLPKPDTAERMQILEATEMPTLRRMLYLTLVERKRSGDIRKDAAPKKKKGIGFREQEESVPHACGKSDRGITRQNSYEACTHRKEKYRAFKKKV